MQEFETYARCGWTDPYKNVSFILHCTRGDQKVCGKVLLNRIDFIDCYENSKI